MGFDHPRGRRLLTLSEVLLSLLLLVVAACMTWQPAAVRPATASPPSNLRVTTTGGAVHDLRDAVIFSDSVRGYAPVDSTYVAIATSDVVRIERRRLARDRTMLLIGGIALTAFIVINNGLKEAGR